MIIIEQHRIIGNTILISFQKKYLSLRVRDLVGGFSFSVFRGVAEMSPTTDLKDSEKVLNYYSVIFPLTKH